MFLLSSWLLLASLLPSTSLVALSPGALSPVALSPVALSPGALSPDASPLGPSSPTAVRCRSSCFIVGICKSRVLTCGDGPPPDLPVLAPVNCSRIKHLVLLDADGPSSIADYIDPGLFAALLKHDMKKSLLIGLGVRHVARFTLSEVPADSSDLVIFLNGFFVRAIERLAFEEKKIRLVFYQIPTPRPQLFQVYVRASVKETKFCDSTGWPCLCKNYFSLNGSALHNHSYIYEESSSMVCKEYYSRHCQQPICALPSRAEHASALLLLSRSKPFPHQYCSTSPSSVSQPLSATSCTAAMFLISLSICLILS